MRRFFSQFARVVNAKHWRSDRTGNSCGFGFVQLETPQEAEILQKTMDGYLMMGRIVKCEVVKECANNIFAKANTEDRYKYQDKMNKPLTQEEHEAEFKRISLILEEKQKKLNAMGIDYTIPELVAVDIE